MPQRAAFGALAAAWAVSFSPAEAQQVNEAVEQTGPDSVWLKNHDAYIASQLRAACKAGESIIPDFPA